MDIYPYFVALGITQLLHSQEEIWTGFHKKWFVFTMPRWLFITFEISFSLPIIVYIFNPNLPFANVYMSVFALLMFINGIEHIIWGLVVKRYVPGLITAPFFIAIFIVYYLFLIRAGL